MGSRQPGSDGCFPPEPPVRIQQHQQAEPSASFIEAASLGSLKASAAAPSNHLVEKRLQTSYLSHSACFRPERREEIFSNFPPRLFVRVNDRLPWTATRGRQQSHQDSEPVEINCQFR